MPRLKHSLGVSLLCLVLLVIAVPAASASITSGPSGSNASLVNTGKITFTIGSTSESCTVWTITGTISGSAASAAATGTAWVGCSYTHVGISGAGTISDSGAWTFTVTASLGAGSYSVSMTNATIIFSSGPCTISVPPNTYSGLTWTNTTKSLVANVSSMKYTSSGILCPLPVSGSNMSLAASFSEPTLTIS